MSKKKNKGKSSPKPTSTAKIDGILSLVIPCYNEENRLKQLLSTLKSFRQTWKSPLEIILINDGSTDNTAAIINQDFTSAFGGDTRFEFVNLSKNQGKGAALKAGVAAADGDYILTLDADMAARPHELANWLKEMPENSFPDDEILIGSREHEGSSIKERGFRRFIGLIFNFIIQLFTNLNIEDTQCGFKLYPKAAAKKLFAENKSGGWAHDVELLYRAKLAGFGIQSLPLKWEAQEDSKINVVSDGIKMFLEVIGISMRVNWDYFIADPIRDLKNKSWNITDPSYYRLLFVLLAVGLFFLMPMLSFDYGITGDEQVQKEYGEKVMAYFDSDGKDKSALNYKNLYYYGGMFDYYAARLHSWFPSWDVYELRHVLNSFFGFILILFTGFLAKQVSGSWRIAFFGMLFMALVPRIFGHSMNNPKDIPFAATYVFSLLYMMRFMEELPRPSKKTIFFLIIGIAAAINTRVGGILLIAYFGLFTGLSFLLRSDLRPLLKNTKVLGKTFLIGTLVVVLGYAGGLMYWPYGRQAPFKNPFTALSEMSDFSIAIRMLFKGEHLWSDELAWYYIPHWMSITLPIFLLLGLLLFVGFYFYKFKLNKRIILAFLAFTAIFPVSYAIIKGSQLYDGMRHFLFVVPVLATLAAWGWGKLMTFKPGGLTYGASAILGLLMLLPGYWMVKNHPYQYLYFNEIFGGIQPAYGEYETDYWMVSMKNMADWLMENEPRMKNGEAITIRTNAYEPLKHYMEQKAPHVKVGYVKYADRYKYKTDYFLFISRFVDTEMIKNGHFPPANVVYEEKADDVILGAITTRPASFDAEANQVLKNKDFQKAAELYAKQIAADPYNESTLENAIKNAMMMQDFPTMKTYVDQLEALSGSYVSGAYYKGMYFNNTGNFAEAKKYLEKAVDLNYKYSAAYFYLAGIYARENNAAKGVEAISMFDKVGGKIPQAYDMGIQMASQLNNTEQVTYFQAKKAYFQKDFQNSYNLIKKVLKMNPNHEQALQLNKVYEASFKK